MKALVYPGPSKKALEARPMPEISLATDAIVRITKATICTRRFVPGAASRRAIERWENEGGEIPPSLSAG